MHLRAQRVKETRNTYSVLNKLLKIIINIEILKFINKVINYYHHFIERLLMTFFALI